MANIKKKSKVTKMVPGEVVKSVASGKGDVGLALYNSLSIKVKTNETEAEREARKFRRRYICKAFDLKADDLEHFLEEYKETAGKVNAMSEADMLKTQEAAAKDEKRATKALDREARNKIIDTIKTIATFAGFSIAPGLTVIASIVGLGIGLKRNKKAKEGQAAKETKEQNEYAERLDGYMSKVGALNKYMEADMAEIMEKKKTLSKDKFSQYMKEKMAGYKEKMRTEGYQIADEAPAKQDADLEQEDEQEAEGKTKPKKKATTKKGKTTTKKKAAAPTAEGSEREA